MKKINNAKLYLLGALNSVADPENIYQINKSVVEIGLPLGPSVGGSFLSGLGDARQAPEGVQAVAEERGEKSFWCVV